MLGPLRTYFFELEKKKRINEAPLRSPHYKKDRQNHFALLLDAGQPDDRSEVMALAEKLRREGHRVKILGFIEGKTEGINMPFDLITSADLSRVSGVPKSGIAEAFAAQTFDVLINLSIRRNYPALDYMSTVTHASFRIGPWYPHQSKSPYDLCLDTGPNPVMKDWVRELLHTLQKIY